MLAVSGAAAVARKAGVAVAAAVVDAAGSGAGSAVAGLAPESAAALGEAIPRRPGVRWTRCAT